MTDRGFTLLELLVAIAIASLAIGSTILYIPTLVTRAEIREVAARLDDLLVEARADALRSGAPASVRLDESASRLISSASKKWLDLPAGASVAIDGVSAGFDKNTTDEAVILFLADGSSSGGLIDIRMNDISVKRRVSWITGRIDAQP